MHTVVPMKARGLVAVAILACVGGTSTRAAAQEPAYGVEPWHQGERVPPGYVPALRSRKGIVLAGSLLLAIPYSLGVTGAMGNALVNGAKRENWLLLPGAGPIVLMAETTNPAGNVFLALDTLTQLAGIAMIAYGIASPVPVLVRDREVLSLTLAPWMGAGRNGVGVVGSF